MPTFSRDIEQLNELVNSILELVRFQTSTEECVAVDVGALLTAVSVNRQDLGENIVLEEVPSTTLTVQIQRIKRCIENLISNGLRYGSKAYVYAHQTEHEYIITVADEGPGIPLAKQAKVMRAHGGCIQFSYAGQRFCVCLHLPLP